MRHFNNNLICNSNDMIPKLFFSILSAIRTWSLETSLTKYCLLLSISIVSTNHDTNHIWYSFFCIEVQR